MLLPKFILAPLHTYYIDTHTYIDMLYALFELFPFSSLSPPVPVNPCVFSELYFLFFSLNSIHGTNIR